MGSLTGPLEASSSTDPKTDLKSYQIISLSPYKVRLVFIYNI